MFPDITSNKRLKSATTVMRVCINYEVAIIWRFKPICISLLKKAPDHWSHVILMARSVSCPLLSKNRVFTNVSTSEVVSTPLRSLNLNQFKKHVKSCDCLSSVVPNYLTRVRYNIPFMQITICVVPVCVYCSDFLRSKYASRLSKFISYVSFQLHQSKRYQTFRLSSIGSIIKLTKL